MSRGNHTLSGGLADQEEVVSVCRYDVRVHNRTWEWVSKSLSVVTLEESLVHSLVDENNHNFNFIFGTNLLDCRLDLGQFVHEDSLALRLAYTITVDNYVSRENPIFVLEFNQAFFHHGL